MDEIKKEEISPIFYFYIHKKLYILCQGRLIKRKKAMGYLARAWKIPRNLRPILIRELEILGLLKPKGRGYLEIEEPTMDFDNVSGLYHLVGLLPY